MLLFLVASMVFIRLFNPNIISSRYVIGITVPILVWSIYMFRQVFAYCPEKLLIWRGLLLTGILASICIVGICKELRFNSRVYRERAAISLLHQTFSSIQKKSGIVFSPSDRIKRIVYSAGIEQVLEWHELPAEAQSEMVRLAPYSYRAVYLLLYKVEQHDKILKKLRSELPTYEWLPETENSESILYRLQDNGLFGTTLPAVTLEEKNISASEDFETSKIVPVNTPFLQHLQLMKVGFAFSEIMLPADWHTNRLHGYIGTGVEEMQLSVKPNGITSHSLVFSGIPKASLVSTLKGDFARSWICSFMYRGSPRSIIVLYIYWNDGDSIKRKSIAYVYGDGSNLVKVARIKIPAFAENNSNWQLAFEFSKGTLFLDNIALAPAK